MAGFFKKTFGKIPEYFKNLEKGQRTRFIVLAAVVVIVIIAASVLLNQKEYTVLYSGMDSKDAGEVLAILEDMNVDARPQGQDTILVEKSKADTVRMQLAAQGYPNSGFNFDIFKSASGLGTTDMEKKVYLKWQLEANLRQTILTFDKVEDAVVNINLSEESAFVLSEDEKPATAAVLLRLKSGQSINSSEVRAIAELVSKSVSGLKIEDVRIVDTNMKLYKIADEEEMESVGTQLQLQQAVQEKLKQQIINLLTPVFGEGKILAEVNVLLNFDSQKSESTVFTSPTGGQEGIAASMKELTEVIKNGATGDVSGTDANGAASQYLSETGDENAVYNKLEREINYEINETKTMIENAKGQPKDLSVSVILDSTGMVEDYRENVRQLVATAIGVAPERITVEMLEFAKIETAEAENEFEKQKELLTSVSNAETTRLIIIATAALAVLLLIFAMIKSLKKAQPVYAAEGGAEGGIDMVADEEVIPEPPVMEVDFEPKEDTSLAQLEKYIDKSPESVAQLLRNWLSDDYGR